jgi:hypothetical protein
MVAPAPIPGTKLYIPHLRLKSSSITHLSESLSLDKPVSAQADDTARQDELYLLQRISPNERG